VPTWRRPEREQRRDAAATELDAHALRRVGRVREIPRREAATPAAAEVTAPGPAHLGLRSAGAHAAEALTRLDDAAVRQCERSGEEEQSHADRVTGVGVALWNRLAELDLEIEASATEQRSVDVSTEFTRVTTVVSLRGGGEEGVGEDVIYTAEDHEWFPEVDPPGRTTLAEFSRALEGLELFRGGPRMDASADYRRWALESAALDLALRQNDLSLGAALGREYRPVRFVVSTRADAFAWLAHDPGLELKLDPENDWDRPLMERLAATGRVRVLDLKAYYRGTPVDVEPDPELYRAVAELFPDAVIEDASLEGECGEVLRGEEGRLSFDAPVHSLSDLLGLPVEPGWLNVKPSRFGTIERLLECIEHCEANGVRMYGGGQFELGPGRRQIQTVASVFYADGPNDVAPAEYNLGEPRPGLPRTPLPPFDSIGF
jgi:hypothetical protein